MLETDTIDLVSLGLSELVSLELRERADGHVSNTPEKALVGKHGRQWQNRHMRPAKVSGGGHWSQTPPFSHKERTYTVLNSLKNFTIA